MANESGEADTLTTVEAVKAQGQSYLAEFSKKLVGEEEVVGDEQEGVIDPEETDLSQSDTEDETEVEAEEAGETDEQSEETEESEDTEDDSGRAGKLDPETQKAIDERIARIIAKERSKQDRLEAENAELREKAENVPIKPDSNDPLSGVVSPKQLGELEANAEKAIDDAEALLDEVDSKPEAVEEILRKTNLPIEDFSPDGMKSALRQIKRNANGVLKAIPKRQAFLDKVEASKAEILKVNPEFSDPDSEQGALYRETLKTMPELRSRPDWPKVIATYIRGLQAEKSAAKVVAKPKPKPKPVKLPSARKASPSSTAQNASEVDSDNLMARVLSGDKEARTGFFQNILDNGKK